MSEDCEVLNALAWCVEANVRDAAWVSEQIAAGLTAERDYWQERAEAAEALLEALQSD